MTLKGIHGEPHRKWQRLAWNCIVLGLAAGAVIVTSKALKSTTAVELQTHAEAVQMLLEATDGMRYRNLQGRLSGGFRYLPFRGAPVDPPLQVQQAALRIEKTLSAHPHAPLRHSLGVAYLLVGKPTRAAAELRHVLQAETQTFDIQNAIRRSTNGPLLNDLAIALHECRRSPEDRLSVEAAHRARAVWKQPESAWNYSLIVETLMLRTAAIEAWEAYARSKDDPNWTAEAQRHAHRLKEYTPVISWVDVHREIQQAFTTRNQHQIEGLISRFPQQAREWIEDEALRQWATDVLNRNADATWKLRTVSSAAHAMGCTTGDQLLHEHAAALKKIKGDELLTLARAHVDYSTSRELYNRGEITKATTYATRSLRVFQRHRLSFRFPAMLTLASCEFISGRYRTVATLATSILNSTGIERRNSSVAGRAHWLHGLVQMETGDPREASAHYRTAAELFRRSAEIDNHAAAMSLLAQAEDSMGLETDSWQARYIALALHDQLQTPRWRHGILIEGAIAAVRTGYSGIPEILLDRLIAVDRAAGDNLGLAAAFRTRSMLHYAQQRERAAEADLALARRSAEAVGDPITRLNIMRRIDTTRALQIVAEDPAEALSILGAVPSSQGTIADVAETTLAISAAQPRSAATAKQLISAIDMLEARLKDDATMPQSPLISRPLVSMYDAAVTRLVELGNGKDALLVSERARASVQRLNGNVRSATPIIPTMSPGSAAIVLYATEHDLISWSIVGSDVSAVIHKAVVPELRALAATIGQSSATMQNGATMRHLTQLVIGSHWARVANAQRLIIVPDDVLWNVPFAAFRRPDGRYVAETAVLELADSLSSYRLCLRRGATRPSRALLILAARPGSSADLRPLPEAGHEIGEVQEILERIGVSAMRVTTHESTAAGAANAHWIHFAGHAVSNPNPGLSYLALDSGHRIYARDIRRWRLSDRPVVFLSACGGATKRGRHLEAWSSIGDAFAHAGATSIIAATTPIDDVSARSFASAFYSTRYDIDPAAAFNAVQRRSIRRNAPLVSWASYTYIIGRCSD